jgi:ATP-binding protein involved in chromosome partitioning
MPPGLGDTTLDAIRLLKNPNFLVVTTPSRVAAETVKKLVALLHELRLPILGILENMSRSGASAQLLPCTARLPFDEGLESALGDPERFLKTEFARTLREVARNTFKD